MPTAHPRKTVSEMPRYIDIEAFAERIKKYVKPETIEEKDLIEWCKDECIRQGYCMPTADVVPRSEYDGVLSNWQKIHDGYTADCLEHYNKGRSDAAREIFEEIDRVAMSKIDENAPISTLDDTVYIQAIDEVRKKYTEGEK